MRSWRKLLLAVVLCFTLPAAAGGFSGTFVGEGGEQIVLSVHGKKVSGQVIVAGTKGKLSARGARARGRSYRSEYQGWALKLAPGWDGQEKDGMLLLGSKREPGMIVVQATKERDPARLRAGLAKDLAEVGLRGDVPSLANSKMPAGTGISAQFPVTAEDGTALKMRAAGVIGPRGTVAIRGTTTPAHFATLRKRVDAMARSITFFKPKVAPGARFVRGECYSFTGVGSFTGGSGKIVPATEGDEAGGFVVAGHRICKH